MPRVRAVRREDLKPADQELFDDLAGTRVLVDGAIQGPFGVMLHSPETARRTAHLGAWFRYQSSLPPRVRHLVALVVAGALECQYEFTVHAGLARRDGIGPEVVAGLARGEMPIHLPRVEAATVELARQLVHEHRVHDATFSELVDLLGLPAVTELVGNIGYLMMLACTLNAFEVEVRPEQTPELPAR